MATEENWDELQEIMTWCNEYDCYNSGLDAEDMLILLPVFIKEHKKCKEVALRRL